MRLNRWVRLLFPAGGGDADVFMWAFDLIELNGDDLRRDPKAMARPSSRTLARHRVEAEGLGLPFRPLARLAQDEKSGVLGGEAGSGGGLGALTAPAGAFSAASHKTSTLRSPAFASSMIVLAMTSSLRSRRHLIAARAISNATPRRRTVSGSKVWPLKKDLMGTRAPSSRQPKLANSL
jgi:hypothetical protein